jgi:hypothetical protein
VLFNKDQQEVAHGELKDGKIELDVSKVPNGAYFLHVIFKDRIEKQQIVIAH